MGIELILFENSWIMDKSWKNSVGLNTLRYLIFKKLTDFYDFRFFLILFNSSAIEYLRKASFELELKQTIFLIFFK